MQKELEKNQIAFKYQRELLQVAIGVQEDERRRIAQDLHDDISSKLNVVALNSHLLMTPDITKEELHEISGNINTMILKAIDNSRKISHDLLPTVLDKFGLDEGLKEFCFELNSSKSVKVNYKNMVKFDDLNKRDYLYIFRIVQELLNNSVRHGEAKNISIVFLNSTEGIMCRYSDDGKGFCPENIRSGKGLGMKSIESRVIFLNGSMSLDSEPGKGMTAILNF
ncbi:MAG: ATP-binding protein [Bacteroidota bacterium]